MQRVGPEPVAGSAGLACLALLAAGALGGPAAARAQAPSVAADGWGGIAVTTGDLVPFHNTGPTFGTGVTLRPWTRVGLRLTGSGQYLLDPAPGGRGGDRRSTLAFHSVHLGLEAELTDPREQGGTWHILVAAAAGATRLDVGESEARPAFTHVNPSGHASVRLARDVGSGWSLFARWSAFLELGDRSDPDDHLGKELTFPLAAGVRYGG